MNPLQHKATAIMLVASALAACGEAHPPEQSPPAVAAAPLAAPATSTPSPPTPPARPGAAPATTKVKIKRGPAIPATVLRKQVLTFLDSLQSLEDTEHERVAAIFKVPLIKDPEMRDGYEYFGSTTEGWNYRIAVNRLYALSDPPTITIALNNGVQPWTDQKPTYCTLDFEELAKDIVALGYERDATRSIYGNKPSWGFGRRVPATRTGFGVGVYLYYLDEGTESEEACVRWFRISGGPRND